MSDAHDAAASAAARELARARWGNQVVSRAASVVVERAAELSPAERAEVARAVAGEDGQEDSR